MQPNFILGLLIATAVLFLWMVILTIQLVGQKRFFAEFTQGVTKKDLKTVLANIAASLKTAGNEINSIHGRIDLILKDDRRHIQKIGFVRFNPFADTGGDQSFCLCFLDEDNNGIVITSLHSREHTRTYAKLITKGKAEGVEFAKEEREALAAALKK